MSIDETLDTILKSINCEMEGQIRTDRNGGRWIFHNGLFYAMCHVDFKGDKQ